MTFRKQLAITTALLALTPFAAQAATDTWSGATSNDWGTATNWSAGVPTATSGVVISNLANNPVQLNTNALLNGTTGALTVGVGTAPGTANVLNINSGDTLTMGARPVSLLGGSITGAGTLSTTGTISGYGTISSLISGTTFSANSTDGTTYTFSPTFKNGTPGTPITLIGQANLTNDSFGISNHGDFNFQGVTLTTPTLTGVSTNLNAGPSGGNNTYGLLSFSGAASTVVGNVNNTNYEQFDVNGTTLHLSNFSLSNAWATNVPPFFVINNGTVDNTTGNSKLNGFMATVLNNGTISNTGGGTFSIAGQVNGNGTVSGPVTLTGGAVASGGTLMLDGTAGAGITVASAGVAASAGNTLDLKGNITFGPSGSFPAAIGLNPGGGTVQLDSATVSGGALQTGAGSFVFATGTNTVNAQLGANGSTGGVPNTTINTAATASFNNTIASTAMWSNNFTMQNGSFLKVAGANNAFSVNGNFSFAQTDIVNAWTFGTTKGLGPDLIMTGSGTSLEVGGLDNGGAGGFVDNFALDSLTLGSNAYVSLVNQFGNAAPGTREALYLDALFGVSPGGSNVIPTLNLDGLDAYLSGYGQLMVGLYINPNGTEVNIINDPEPATLAVLATGLLGLGLVRRRRT